MLRGTYNSLRCQCTCDGRQTTPPLRGPLGAHKLAGEAHAEVGGSGRRRAMPARVDDQAGPQPARGRGFHRMRAGRRRDEAALAHDHYQHHTMLTCFHVRSSALARRGLRARIYACALASRAGQRESRSASPAVGLPSRKEGPPSLRPRNGWGCLGAARCVLIRPVLRQMWTYWYD